MIVEVADAWRPRGSLVRVRLRVASDCPGKEVAVPVKPGVIKHGTQVLVIRALVNDDDGAAQARSFSAGEGEKIGRAHV